MANGMQNTSSVDPRRFDKELNEDVSDFHLPPDSWTKARNAINNSVTGDLGKLGNEPSNSFCIKAPYPIIGFIHITADRWAVFSTNDTDSEIGLFEEGLCKYDKIVNDRCLKFNRTGLIKGVSRRTADCSYQLYWDDGINPSRTLDIENIPYKQICTDETGTNVNDYIEPLEPQGCITCVDLPELDCNKIRLAALVEQPCITVKKGATGGTLANGMYFATIAYTIDGQKITDYSTLSNQQPIFAHDNAASSIEIVVDSIDTRYDEYELVIITVIAQQTVARRVGLYSTHQRNITLDAIQFSWPAVPIEFLPIRTTVTNKSDAMYKVNNYLLRVGTTSKFDFNYQPLANQIVTKWTSTEYPQDYYQQGGSNTSYMRDEVYPFFIRWLYDTGDKSALYHIPGRPAVNSPYSGMPGPKENSTYGGVGSLAGDDQVFETFNTATSNPSQPLPYVLDDGGVVIDEGYMGYWESTEKYPDQNGAVWNANDITHPSTVLINIPYPGTNLGSLNTITGAVVPGDYDLCGKRIRHHKFPDNSLNGLGTSTSHFAGASPNFNGNPTIRVLGIKFENIRPPVDNEGNIISEIIGYEILRGSRSGNRTVLAKGMINNMGLYDVDPGITNRKAAYPNYPYNDLRPDPFLSTKEAYYKMCFLGLAGGEWAKGSGAFDESTDLYKDFSRTLFTFHSPETAYDRPFLSGKELKICGQLQGTAIGKFEYSENHPKFKMISNVAFIISALAGLGLASLKMNGERTMERTLPRKTDFVDSGVFAGPAGIGAFGLANLPVTPVLLTAAAAAQITGNTSQNIFLQGSSLLLTLNNALGISENNIAFAATPLGGLQTALNATLNGFGSLPGMSGYGYNITKTSTAFTEGNDLMNIIMGIPLFSHYWADGTDTTINLIYAILKFRDYALKYNSHCFYNGFAPPPALSEFRRTISEQQYLDDQITDFGTGYKINNLYRSKTVALSVSVPIVNPVGDNTRQKVSDTPALYDPPAIGNPFRVKDPTKASFATYSTAYYVAYKQRLRNQYGQVDSIRPVPVSTCWGKRKNISTSQVLFNGDVYISRYTEKNTFFYFYDWLDGQPDGFEFDYFSRKMMPYPRYWMNSQRYDTSDFTTGLISNLANITNAANWEAVLPSNFFNLDGYTCDLGSIVGKMNFGIKYAYFYLFNSGVRDFFVESELNVGLRDWGFQDSQKHYPIADVKELFHSSIIKSGNYFAYDQSLSITRNFVNNTPWGEVQGRDYTPLLAETCYTYSPNTVIYSLPAIDEVKRDSWLFFLANNYKTFLSKITCIKPVNKNGALILFADQSPVQFYGTDQLETDAGTKLTIGDGGLFQQPLQNLTNADASYEYASCQDRLSVINTPAGVFWISQNQGKIFNYLGQLNEISRNDLKWWFASYLPYKLTEQFPTFELKDNPVIGIGCQSIYDNENSLVYFTKRDFIVRTDLPQGTVITYVDKDNFLVNGVLPIKLGNPLYFEDASWTISYDPKTGAWVSWHDWHPNLMLPGKNTFMTVMNSNTPGLENGVWIHNERCDSYCNYYGANYPFEVEYMVHTVQQVNTVRSIEYLMEVYKYGNNCFDRFHSLDFNFDEAVVYNTEQCSGLLKLNVNPKNNPVAILLYPQVGLQDINILYSKEEQKFRFNQFWDITADRGEFNVNAERVIWNTSANGYVRSLNPNNLNYSKNPLERKKFRHYVTFVLLRRNVSGDKKMLVMITNNKNLQSLR